MIFIILAYIRPTFKRNYLFRDAMYGRMEAVCPFFAFYSLSDMAEELLPNSVLDVHINASSINAFKNLVGPQSEQFYWPSSTSFSLKCVSEASCIELEMLGIQRQVCFYFNEYS